MHWRFHFASTTGPNEGERNVEKLLNQLAEIDAKIEGILAGDALTDDSRKTLASLEADRANVEERIGLQKKADARAAERAALQADEAKKKAESDKKAREIKPARVTAPDAISHIEHAEPIDHDANQRLGFDNFGQFAQEVRRAGTMKAPTQRLLNVYGNQQYAAVVGMNEGISSEGGAFIPPQFMAKVMSRINAGASLLPRTDQYTIPADTMTWPRNLETSRATGSRYGGIQTYWRGEGAAPTAKFPKVGKFTLNLHKLISLAGVTDELLRDANGSVLEQYLTSAFSEDMGFEVDAAIVAGTGAGQPAGLKDAACAVSVSKETSQAAATINPQNIVKMWSRLWAGCRSNAVWLINQDTEPQLNLMSFGLGTSGQMLYMPPGGLSASPYATLMGRPVIAVEQCETLGTKGDIILTDLKHYITASNGGPVAATSAHLYFDTDQMAFRLTFRIDGAPWWASALTPYKGTATQSCIVTLATRA